MPKRSTKVVSNSVKTESLDDPIYQDSPDNVNYLLNNEVSMSVALKPKTNGKLVGNPPVEEPDNIASDDIKQDKQDVELWEKLKLPKLPCRVGGRMPNILVAEEWFSLVTSPEAADRIYIYVYRVWPKILRAKHARNIEKVPLRLYSMNKLIANHGGGEYKMMVTDTAQTNSSLFEVLFTVDSQLYEPILNQAELDLTAKENVSYIEALKNKGMFSENRAMLNSNANTNLQPNNSQLQSNNTTDRIADVLGDVVKQLLQQSNKDKHTPLPVVNDGNMSAITQLLLEKLKQDDPNKGLAGIAELIKALKPAEQPKSEDTSKPIIELILSEVKELRASNARLQEKLLDNQTNKQDNSIEQIEKVLSIVDKIKHRNDEDDDNKPTGKMSLVDRLIDKGLPLLAPVLQGLALRNMGATQQQAADLGNLNKAIVASDYPTQIPNQNVSMPENSPVETQQDNQPNSQLTQLVINYGGMIAEKIVSGVTGWEFALDLESLFGNGIWQQVTAYQPSQIVAAFKSVPQFWSRVEFKTESYVSKWISEFIEYKRYAALAEANMLEDSDEEMEESPELTN